MGDPTQPATTQIDDAAMQRQLSLANDLVSRTNELNSQLEKLRSQADNLSKTPGGETLGRQLNNILSSAGKLPQAFSSVGSSVNQVFSPFKENTAQTFGFFNSIAAIAQKSFAATGESAKIMHDVLGSGGVVAVTKLKKEFLESFNNMGLPVLDMQEKLMAVEKTAVQTGISLGKSFYDASSMTSKTIRDISDLKKNLYISDADIDSMRKAFSAIDVSDQLQSLTNLQVTFSGTNTALSNTSAAFLAAKATGTELTEVAGLMNTAFVELGQSVDTLPLILGNIKEASEKSGLSFDLVGKSVVGAASSMRMWGMSVESASRIFSSFADGLKSSGLGKFITKDLFETFMQGLNQMQFGVRALTGMQLPGMAGKGAIGIGLRMEQMMEKGDMQGIAQSISQTLKQFGGGRVLTRQEAIENPALERNFMVQRGLLEKMLPGLDPAKATRMLQALQNIDKTGVESSGTTEDTLKELMASGERVTKNTTSDRIKADAQYQQATLSQGKKLLNAVKRLEGVFGIDKALSTLSAMMNNAIKSGKPLNISDFNDVIRPLDNLLKNPAQIAKGITDPNAGVSAPREKMREIQERQNIITGGIQKQKEEASLAVGDQPRDIEKLFENQPVSVDVTVPEAPKIPQPKMPAIESPINEIPIKVKPELPDFSNLRLPTGSLQSDLSKLHIPTNSLQADLEKLRIPTELFKKNIEDFHISTDSLQADLENLYMPTDLFQKDIDGFHITTESIQRDLDRLHIPVDSLQEEFDRLGFTKQINIPTRTAAGGSDYFANIISQAQKNLTAQTITPPQQRTQAGVTQVPSVQYRGGFAQAQNMAPVMSRPSVTAPRAQDVPDITREKINNERLAINRNIAGTINTNVRGPAPTRIPDSVVQGKTQANIDIKLRPTITVDNGGIATFKINLKEIIVNEIGQIHAKATSANGT